MKKDYGTSEEFIQKYKKLCALNPKTWKYNADLKLSKIGETLHYSWGNTEVTS